MSDSFPFPSYNSAVLDFLSARRSNLAKAMTGPGPDADQLDTILQIGTRVPDHRKLTPWSLVVFQGEARATFGHHIAAVYQADNPDHPDDRVSFEADRFLRAPLVIAVISTPKDCLRGTPVWEQQLSAGAVCMNLCLAAQASGFGAQWLTEWYAYDARVHAALDMSAGDQVAGFIYVGTPTQDALPRQRPHRDDVIHFASSQT
ncbi:nitroreductase [Algimonas arctica]|uniref:Putative NAD(P)H nitroreductase n=1 Tax=Algimonas arctica TaxID=1479486 RepID=A0A8J3CR03_9PROT|nr:nitroreductase [Algimonas arctica]GHA89154.1 nitroreductase [Algimonas arctica]